MASTSDLRRILGELSERRWADPERLEEDADAGAITSGTLLLCERLAVALRQATTAEEAIRDLDALRVAFSEGENAAETNAALDALAKRLEDVISVESRCILTSGCVAKEQALVMVAEILTSLLHVYRLGGTEAVRVGQTLLPNMLECILVGITKCWQSDWNGHLRPQLQPMHDLVLRRPLLEKAAFALLRLVWQRAPSLLDDSSTAVAVSPQCAYAIASLSQEIHDELMATDLADAQQSDLELMTHLRRVVLEFLGQAGLRRRHRRKAPPIPMLALTTPSPKKRGLEEVETEPRPSHKSRNLGNMDEALTSPPRSPVEPGDAFPEPKKQPGFDKMNGMNGIDSLMEVLLKDYGASSLATSLADRAEKCIESIAWAASKSISPEAVEAKEAVQARQSLNDFVEYLRILMTHSLDCVAWQMPRFVQRLCDSGTWEDAWRFSLAKVLDLVVHPNMAPQSATALWAQVVGGSGKCPKRMKAVASLAKELDIVLTFSDKDYTKLQDSMRHLINMANNCLRAEKEEAKPSGSRNGRCDSESEEIGSQDTLSELSGESEPIDFSDFEDARPEMNNLGFLKADGQMFCGAPEGPAPGSEQLRRHTSNLKGDWKDRLEKLFDLVPDDEAEKEAETDKIPIANEEKLVVEKIPIANEEKLVVEKIPIANEEKLAVAEEDLPKGSSWRS